MSEEAQQQTELEGLATPNVPPSDEPKTPKLRAESRAISINKKGLVAAKDNAELLRYCGALIQGESIPKQFNTPQKLFGALMFVRSLGLPDTSIRNVAMIHGTPTIHTDLPLSLVQMSGQLECFKEIWFDRDYNEIKFENKNLHTEPWGAVCFARRKGETEIQSFSSTLDDAKQAGVYPNNSASPWTKYTRLMLRYKARSICLKSLFADKLNGVAIAEYDFDQTEHTLKDVSPAPSAAEQLNKTFMGDEP